MEILSSLLSESGLLALRFANLVMFAVGGLLIYLAIRKGYEPLLLIPIGFGVVLANLPYVRSDALDDLPVATSFEPRHALDGGPDGLAVIGRLLEILPQS